MDAQSSTQTDGIITDIPPFPRQITFNTPMTQLVPYLFRRLKTAADAEGVDPKMYKWMVDYHPLAKKVHTTRALIFELAYLHVQHLVTFELCQFGKFLWIKKILVPASSKAALFSGFFPPQTYFKQLPYTAVMESACLKHGKLSKAVWRRAGFVEKESPNGDLVFNHRRFSCKRKRFGNPRPGDLAFPRRPPWARACSPSASPSCNRASAHSRPSPPSDRVQGNKPECVMARLEPDLLHAILREALPMPE